MRQFIVRIGKIVIDMLWGFAETQCKAIGKLIMTDQTHQLPSQLQTGKDFGMQMFDQALLSAVQAREVDPDDAFSYATEKRLLQKFVTDTTIIAKNMLAQPPPPG